MTEAKWYKQGKADVCDEVLKLIDMERKGFVPEEYQSGCDDTRNKIREFLKTL